MIEFKNTILINRPLQEVFSYISDFENLPKWNHYVKDVAKLSDGPVGVGTTYHQTRNTDQQRFKVVEFKLNKAVAIETLPPEKRLYMRFSFKTELNGTRVVDEWALEADTPGPIGWLAAKRVKFAVLQNLKKLKKLLEAGQVTL